MDESERNRLKKLHRVLLLAAAGMGQAETATHALDQEKTNLFLQHALETSASASDSPPIPALACLGPERDGYGLPLG